MIKKKAWEEFRKTGLLWFVNVIIHVFGWAIVVEVEDGKIIDSYPARVKFRGFDEASNTIGYKNVSEYMKENASELLEEAKEDGANE